MVMSSAFTVSWEIKQVNMAHNAYTSDMTHNAYTSDMTSAPRSESESRATEGEQSPTRPAVAV